MADATDIFTGAGDWAVFLLSLIAHDNMTGQPRFVCFLLSLLFLVLVFHGREFQMLPGSSLAT